MSPFTIGFCLTLWGVLSVVFGLAIGRVLKRLGSGDDWED
jgi:hypothetical protein